MRYAIFADVHSNLEALEAVLAAYENESIDKYLCVGDVVGYAANPRECIQNLKNICTITVAGNHDWASVNLFSTDKFNNFAAEAIFWTRQNLGEGDRYFLEALKLTYQNEDLTLVHGTLDRPGDFNYLTDGYIAEETFNLMQTNVCFIGHSHVAGIFIKGQDDRITYRQDNSMDIKQENKYIINVGSVGQPRDGIPYAAYCVYDTKEKELWIKRVNYDRETTRKKIIAAGLPGFLGDRLMMGR